MEEQVINPLLLSVKDAAKLLGISPSSFRKLHNSGRLGPLPIRLSIKLLFSRRELVAWIKADCPARVQWQAIKQSQKERKVRRSA